MYASVPALNRSGTVHSRRSTGRRRHHPPGAAVHLSLARGRAAPAAHASLEYILTPVQVAAPPRSRRNSASGGAPMPPAFSRTLSLPPQQRQTPVKAGPWWLPARLRASRKTLGTRADKVSSRPDGPPPTPSPDYGDTWWERDLTTSTNTRPHTRASARSERRAPRPPPRHLCHTERPRRPPSQHASRRAAEASQVSTARM